MNSNVEDKIRQFPGDGELSPEVLDTMREKFTSKKLRQDFERRLSRQFPSLVKQHRDQSLKDHPLALFMCYHDSCTAGKTGPLTSITAMHPCLCNRSTPRKLCLLEKVPGGAYDYAVREVFQFAPWKFGHLKLHWDSGAMKHLMELGGIDPALGTAQDMDKADFFVQCHSCKNKVRGMTMGWRTAFHHMSTTHITGNLDLRLAGEEETKLARTLTKETEKASREAHEKLSLWQCLLCPANKRIPILKPELVVHLKHEHRRSDLREGENHERDPRSPPYVPHAVALLLRGSDKNLKETEKQWLEQGYAKMMKK